MIISVLSHRRQVMEVFSSREAAELTLARLVLSAFAIAQAFLLGQDGSYLYKVLASSDRDTHLSAPLCHLSEGEMPNFNMFLATLQTRIEYLVNHPDLPADACQRTLLNVLSDLQQFQHSLS